MNTLNKYDLLKEVIVQTNELVDARGVDKCVLIINIVQKLNTIEGLMRDEDSNHDAAIRDLANQIDTLKAKAAEVDDNADTDAE